MQLTNLTDGGGVDCRARIRHRSLQNGGESRTRSIVVEGSLLDSDGGFLCLVGTLNDEDFTRTAAYGDTRLDTVLEGSSSDCNGRTIDEHVTDYFPPAIPGPGESYQRTGFGLFPEDFEWTVAASTPGRLNAGQIVSIDPVTITVQPSQICPEQDRCDDNAPGALLFHRRRRYTLHRDGPFRDCQTRCIGGLLARVSKVFFWRCGGCM